MKGAKEMTAKRDLIRVGAAYFDEPPDESRPWQEWKFRGSIFIFEAANEEEVLQRLKEDIYATSVSIPVKR